jgi:molecular chaperone GrpE
MEKKVSEKKNGNETKAKSTKKNATKQTNQVKDLKKKISDLEELVIKHTEENEKVKDQLLRTMAEFDNYKRRTEKEIIENIQSAGREVIEDLLPVIDDFQRSLQHADPAKSAALLEGINLVYKNFMKVLTRRGLTEIDAVGKEFNPDEHDALMQVDSEKYESGFVVDEHSKGYKLNDKVIRHAQVMVAK